MQPQIACSKHIADSARVTPGCNNGSSGIASISIFDGFIKSPVGFLSMLNSMTGKQGLHPFENINPQKVPASEIAEKRISFLATIENKMSHILNQGHLGEMNQDKLSALLNSYRENITALKNQLVRTHEFADAEGINHPDQDVFTFFSHLKLSDSEPGIHENNIPLNFSLDKDGNRIPGEIAPDDQEAYQVKTQIQLKNNAEKLTLLPDSNSGDAARLSDFIQKEIKQYHVRSDKVDPVNSCRSESETQIHEDHDSKPAMNILRNRVSSINSTADQEIALKSRVADNLSKISDSQKKEINQIHEEKAPDQGKDTSGRVASDLTKVHRPFIIDSVSMQRFIANNHSLQKTQTPDAILNVKQLVSSESGTGEETTLASNHQNQDKNAGSVVQSKEIHYFDRSFQPTVMKQVVDKAILSLKNGQSSIKLNLRPDVLGQLKMHISTENSQVSIRIITDVPVVKDIIESNLTQLKADFQNQGLEIEKFDVSVGQGSTYNNGTSGHFPFQEKISAGVDGTVKSDISEDSQENAHHAEMQEDSSRIDYFA